jgi:osmotically-inducible protein OsmY
MERDLRLSAVRQDTTMGTSLLWQTDTQLHDSVQRQLEWDPEIDASGIAVVASEGVVTLTGFVHTYAAKLAAERSVKRVRGVRGVANDLQVALRGERTDPDIAKDAVHALRAHTSVPNSVTVTVRDGFTTLEGYVDWMFQKVAAGLAVSFLDGVKGVSNLIQVRPSVSAGQIKTDIDDALRRSAEVDAQQIHVRVDGSIVTLSGRVHSCHEKQESARAAWAAPGVTHVANLIVVMP